MKKDIRILLVDDHQVVREGLQHMLEQEEDMEVVGQSANGEEALSQVEMLSPNIVLMDIKMPGMNGIELTRQLKEKKLSCKIIMLTLYDEYLAEAIEAGAVGYLLKDTKRAELTQSIRQVHHGQVVISDSITSKPLTEYEERYGTKAQEGFDNMFEEVQLVISSPVEANQLMRFASQVEEILQSRVLRVVGSWQEGTVMTIILAKPTSPADILNKLGEVPEVEALGEKPLTGETSPRLIRKAAAIPRLKTRLSKIIFVTLKMASLDEN